MATIYGANFDNDFNKIPQIKGAVGENGGRVRIYFDSFSGAAAADVLVFGKILKDARIIRLGGSGLGTSPAYSVSVGEKVAAAADLSVTLGAGALASGFVFVEFILD